MQFRFAVSFISNQIFGFLTCFTDKNVGTCGENWNVVSLLPNLVCEKDFIRTVPNFSNEPFQIGFHADVEGTKSEWAISHFHLRVLQSL